MATLDPRTPSILSPAPRAPLPPGTSGGATSLEHQGEKQLFEKFWRGTFNAVAKPRAESVIVASITARRRANSTATVACQPLTADERQEVTTNAEVGTATGRDGGYIREKRRHKHGSYRRTRSVSYDDDLSPRPHAPKGKKKKRKSQRKRKRKRSPSCSLSPVRKRKKRKKNKKSSKKSKRHRYTSKKIKHSSSSLKRKRRDDRKHNKSSKGHTHRRRRHQRSESEDSSAWRSSSAESRRHRHKSADNHSSVGCLSTLREDPGTASIERRGFEWGPAIKSVCKRTQIFRSILSASTVLQSKPGGEVLNRTAVHRPTLTNQSKGSQDYDSGNDTSSPPSTKTGVSRTNTSGDNRVQAPASPEKLKFTDGDNASDSGNSVTSYASLCKPLHVNGSHAPIYNVICKSDPKTATGDGARLGSTQKTQKTVSSIAPLTVVATSRKRTRANASSSRSRSRSSASSRISRRYARSQSQSSARSYSRSSSCSAGWRKKGSVDSVMSRGSYSRYSKERIQERKRDPISCEKGLKYSSRKRSGKRRRRRSYSPMRKRRRDSPSHLEARRITSARKRPIPYFRPSPSSSRRSTSVSSWSSIFTRSRSPSPSPGFYLSRSRSRSRSRRRSRSYSSYRSYSRSSSWNSSFGSRSRSRSYDSQDGYSRAKRRH